MNKRLIIMRGVSGSGKSTLAAQLAGDEGVIFSTDNYFMEDGEYRFNPKKLGAAHQWNQTHAREAMKQGHPLVIIDNTNTQAWEVRPYCEAAQEHGYTVEFHEPTTSWARDPVELAKRNTHGVPLEAIKRMLDRFEEDLTVDRCLVARAPWEK